MPLAIFTPSHSTGSDLKKRLNLALAVFTGETRGQDRFSDLLKVTHQGHKSHRKEKVLLRA